MKLELKHLTPYLPYKLNVKWGAHTFEVLGASFLNRLSVKVKWYNQTANYADVKPILNLPEDYLTNEIAHDLEWVSLDDLLRGIEMGHFNYKDYIFFCENHINFNGLIEKGLAIDKNTLS